MIEQAPKDEKKIVRCLLQSRSTELSQLIEAINSDYKYWSEVKYKPLPKGIKDHQELWYHVKAERMRKSSVVWPSYNMTLSLTNHMQALCHSFDMRFGGSWGDNTPINSSDKTEREHYLLSSLLEEAISSSQIEGASTTRRIAKDMLRKGASPVGKSQQMIYNNYQAIQFIKEHKTEELSLELLLRLHELMTYHTLDDKDIGRLRSEQDDVIVEDGITHEVVHHPPHAEDLEEFVKDLCDFFNAPQGGKPFIHPIIRGIIIHFMIGFMHPFVDGNGRTARALFYWYMLKQDYWLMEYLSISSIIQKSKKQYEKAYLYVEADEHDLGYFVQYQLKVLKLAFEQLEHYITRKRREQELVHQNMPPGLSLRQAEILQLYDKQPSLMLTVKELENRFGITPTTAKSDLKVLMQQGYIEEIALNKVKRGYLRKK